MNLLLPFILIPLVLGQTIAEKKANLNKGKSDLPFELDQRLEGLNQLKAVKEDEIRDLYKKGWVLYENGAPKEAYELVLNDLRKAKRDLEATESGWQKHASKVLDPEPYGLFHQPETTIEQLIIDYGSQDFVYLIPREVGSLPISLSSHLPVPRGGWNEMVELILQQSGVVITPLNPYLRKLSLAKDDFSHLRHIIVEREMLAFIPRDERVLFLLSPDALELKRAELFLDKFANKGTQQVIPLGRQIAIVAPRGEVEELIRLYDFFQKENGSKDYSLIALQKISGEEMARMLAVLFDEGEGKEGGDSLAFGSVNSLKILVSKSNPRALFLVGSRAEVKRAEEIIRKVEGQMGDYKEKALHWYCAKYADPEELADVLSRIYDLMICGQSCDKPTDNSDQQGNSLCSLCPPIPELPDAGQAYTDSFYQVGSPVVNPSPIELTGDRKKTVNKNRQNFIVDQKTGAIVMVVEAELLPQLLETIRRLDVPKKMVQIEVLLFERRTNDRNQFGLNLFKVGGAALHQKTTSLVWNDPCRHGILDFFFSRNGSCNFAPFDLLYTFMIAQEDIQINSAPSVLATNQTEAVIAIVDEISINTGIFDIPTTDGAALKDSFTRAQYGIKLNITPTIHTGDDPYGEEDLITLSTKVNFDTIHPGVVAGPNRPDVTRREVNNEATVADGESVIIGGLRRKTSQAEQDKLPYLGEIPCIGKFFSFTTQCDTTTEMFIIITPKIVRDPLCGLEWIKKEEMCRRPGDLPDYLCRLEAARTRERNCFLAGTIEMIAGPPRSRCYSPGWMRDGSTACP